jgi:FTR1 family protein
MLQAFIITLREGVEAALIVGITLAYLAKIGRTELRKTVYAAMAAAFLGSIGVAVVISRTHLNEDVFEGWVMLVAAFFVVTMVIFMMKTGRKLKGDIEGKVGLLVGNDAWFGLFIFIFLMVLREGAETVLILSAVSLNSTELMSFLGTLLGVMAAVAFGVMFVKGSVRINLQKFFRVTTAILFLVAVQLLISGLHELSESGVIASSKREMALVGPVLLCDHLRAGGADGALRRQAPRPGGRAGIAGRAPKSGVERASRAFVDDLGLFLLVHFHRTGNGGIHLHQVGQRAFARDRSYVYEWSGENPAIAGFRRRPAPIRSQRKQYENSLLALPEARRQGSHGF